MLLRRITEHVKAQNWTAVALDFVIVVVGVFIGIQVANWNQARLDDALSREYLVRLHSELEEIQANGLEATSGGAVSDGQNELSRYERLKELGEYLAENDNAPMPNETHCQSLYRSHIYIFDILSVPTLEEMLSTGRILLIKDDDLRNQLVSFRQSREAAAALLDNMRSDRLVLSRAHNDLIKLKADDVLGTNPVCDFEGMRASQAFINDFADNLGRYRAYAEYILQAQQGVIADLHDSVDNALNIQHDEAKQ